MPTKPLMIETDIGTIAVYRKVVPDTVPIIFLHGVYYDHNLWNYYTSRILDRTVITVDMPLHGKSKSITNEDWNMADCADMLIEIIDSLGYDQLYAVGHSWGSMTILRAAAQFPDRFTAIGLCNMPYEKGSLKAKLQFKFQHTLLPFRGFYTKQVAKAMFSKESSAANPEIGKYLAVSMSQLSNKDVVKTDSAVITGVDAGSPYLEKLTVPALALRGDQDYVGTPRNIKTTIVPGAHTSPLERPEELLTFINKVLALTRLYY